MPYLTQPHQQTEQALHQSQKHPGGAVMSEQ